MVNMMLLHPANSILIDLTQAEKGSNAVPVNEEGESIPEISFNNEEVGESTAKTAQSFPLEEEHSAQQAALPIWRFMIIIAG